MAVANGRPHGTGLASDFGSAEPELRGGSETCDEMRWINRRPRSPVLLATLPFIVIAAAYLSGSSMRLAENPNDKLMPSPARIADAWREMALEIDVRSETYLFWRDTAASLGRMAIGLTIATSIALVAGVAIGVLPYLNATLAPLVTTLSTIPALAVLPILFIIFGVGEVSKVALIVIGVTPFMIRDLTQRVHEIPEEQWIKAQTLGASSWHLAIRIVLPQILPRLIDALRLSLGPAWLFLISAEAISATSGLGYRIFLVRRYLSMDVILPYVAWITFLAFGFDYALRLLRRRRYAWIEAESVS